MKTEALCDDDNDADLFACDSSDIEVQYGSSFFLVPGLLPVLFVFILLSFAVCACSPLLNFL